MRILLRLMFGLFVISMIATSCEKDDGSTEPNNNQNIDYEFLLGDWKPVELGVSADEADDYSDVNCELLIISEDQFQNTILEEGCDVDVMVIGSFNYTRNGDKITLDVNWDVNEFTISELTSTNLILTAPELYVKYKRN